MNGSCDLYLSRTPDLWINLQEARCCFDCWIPKTKLLTEKSEILQGQHDLKVPHFCVEFSNKTNQGVYILGTNLRLDQKKLSKIGDFELSETESLM